MSVTEFSYSDFLRGPTKVLPALKQGDVLLERRNEEGLVVTRAGRYSASMQGMALTVVLIKSLTKNREDLLEPLMAEALPWIIWLPPADRHLCISELLAQYAAGAETGTFEPFVRARNEWRHTAEVWSDPELAARLSSSTPGDGPEIPRPKAPRKSSRLKR